MSKIIPPTPGRVVWFYPSESDLIGTHPQDPKQPLAAVVAGVFNDRLINVVAFDFYGNPKPRCGVALVQPGDELPSAQDTAVGYCTWMPYQIGQAGGPDDITRFGWNLTEGDSLLHKEAADRIEQLEAENQTMKAERLACDAVCDLLYDRLPAAQCMGELPGCVDELQARIAALEAALREGVKPPGLERPVRRGG